MVEGEVLITAPVEKPLDDALTGSYVVHRLWMASDTAGFLASVADRVHVVVTRSMIGADRALMKALPKLKLVAVFGVGTDAVDLVAACKIINENVLRALGPEGFLINIARASVVDYPALVAALQQGHIKGAALDVFPEEPQVPAALLELDNVIVEPHIASTTVETRAAIGDLVLANVNAYFAGVALPSPVEGTVLR